MQLLAAPYSSLHENETLLWTRRDELGKFIKTVARGAKFAPEYRVEQTQILRAFRAWLDGNSSKYAIKDRDAIDRDLHSWDGYFSIDVARAPRDPAEIRLAKTRSTDGLIDLFDDWAKNATSFEADVDSEFVASAKGYIDAYLRYAVRVGSGDFSALLNSPVMSKVVEMMMHMLPQELPVDERLQRCSQFFGSAHFRELPCQLIPATIYAVLKDSVKRGAFANRVKARKRLSGFFYDVAHISTYAPYCDAIIVDQTMGTLLSDPRLTLEARYGVKVFTLRDWPQLYAWLDDIEAGATSEHRDALAAINAR